MQAEVYSAGGATSPTPVTTVVSGDLQVQSVPNGQSATSENPAFHSISTSAVTFAPEQSSVSFARKREPSETETTITTDIVALPLDSSSNLRQRSSVVKMQKQGAGAGAGAPVDGVGVSPKSAADAAWQPFPLAALVGRRRDLSSSEKKSLKKGTLEYYKKQNRWVDELVEADHLFRTTQTTTKLPPLPTGTSALATSTELETLLEGDAGDGGCNKTKENALSTPNSTAPRGNVERERDGTTHTASVEVLNNLSAGATPANGAALKAPPAAPAAAAEDVPAVVIPTGISSFETQLTIDATGGGAAGADEDSPDPADAGKTVEQLRRDADRKNIIATRVAKVLLCINLVLICFKLVAVIMSGSLAVVAVLVDNAVDLASGVVIWVSNVAVRKRNIYSYPQGRKRLEPVGIVVLAAIMAVASAQVIMESVTKLVRMIFTNPDEKGPEMGWLPIGLLITDFLTKTTLFIVFFRFRKGNPSIQAMQLDLRNDMVSNVASLFSGLVASGMIHRRFFDVDLKYVDPGVAILIALYIAISWGLQLIRQARMLTGFTAPREFLNKVTWIAVSHDPRIVQLETVRAFHAGMEYFVEVDIVLPTDMSVRVAHDIGESLQQKLELLPNVARAFVHVDHESYHNTEIEHKAG